MKRPHNDLEQVLKRTVKFLVLFTAGVLALLWYVSSQPQKVIIADGIKGHVLDQDIMTMLRREYPTTFHKLILYDQSLLAFNCPYAQIFANAFKAQKGRIDLERYYDFVPLKTSFSVEASSRSEADALMRPFNDFFKLYGPVCVLDMNRGWVVSLLNEDDTWSMSANKLGPKLDTLKDK